MILTRLCAGTVYNVAGKVDVLGSILGCDFSVIFLADKIAPTEDMVSVDTLSLPGASIIVYNNWPRVPTGTPCFITRYCQVCMCVCCVCLRGCGAHMRKCTSMYVCTYVCLPPSFPCSLPPSTQCIVCICTLQ